MTDPIADMLTRIRNAVAVSKKSVIVPHSKVKEALTDKLKSEGYITDYSVVETDYGQPDIKIVLKYIDDVPVITTLKRVSKPGLRVYVKGKNITPVLSGHGISILSTSKGIKTREEALKENLGGELLCEVW